jgi:hypothetical protein
MFSLPSPPFQLSAISVALGACCMPKTLIIDFVLILYLCILMLLYCSFFTVSHAFLRFEQESNRDSLCALRRVLCEFFFSCHTLLEFGPEEELFRRRSPLRYGVGNNKEL